MVRIINSKIEGLVPGSRAEDGVNFSQLDARITERLKRQAYWHGTPVSGVYVSLANGTTILDTVESTPPFFYPSQVFIRQINSGSFALAAASINVGTNAPNYNNVITINQAMISGLSQGRYIPLTLTGGVAPLTANSVIYVRIAGLIANTTLQLGIDILGSYRNT